MSPDTVKGNSHPNLIQHKYNDTVDQPTLQIYGVFYLHTNQDSEHFQNS